VELKKYQLSLDNESCLRDLCSVYAQSINHKSEISTLLLALIYLKESSLYENENCIKELKAINADTNINFPLIYKVELTLLLIKELNDNNLRREAQNLLVKLAKLDHSKLDQLQVKFIKKHLLVQKSEIKLKGKELVLYSALEVSPTEKFDLIFKIYGDDCDISKSERSFKTLLNRLRKKIDQEIILNTKNLYELR
jgi:hypothetical protein